MKSGRDGSIGRLPLAKMGGPIEGLKRQDRFHRLEVFDAMNQRNLMLKGHGGDQAIRSSGCHAPLP